MSTILSSAASHHSFLPSRYARAAMITATECESRGAPWRSAACGCAGTRTSSVMWERTLSLIYVGGILVIAGQRHEFLRALQVRDCPRSCPSPRPSSSAGCLRRRCYQRRLLAHDAREAVAIVAEAGGVAHQKSLRDIQQRLERVRILAAVMPGEDAAMRHHRARKVVVHEVVDQVDSVAHPLVGDAAREVLVQAEFEVQPRVEGPIRFVEQPACASRCPPRGSVSLPGGRASVGRDSSRRSRIC